LEKKCLLTDWRHGGGGGWGDRGKGRRLRGYFIEQQYPPPYNLFFFSGYGFDPFLQQGTQFRPPRGPMTRGTSLDQKKFNQGQQQQVKPETNQQQ
jgi:hypothetical protein